METVYWPTGTLRASFPSFGMGLTGDVGEGLLHRVEAGVDPVEAGNQLLVDCGVLFERLRQVGVAAANLLATVMSPPTTMPTIAIQSNQGMKSSDVTPRGRESRRSASAVFTSTPPLAITCWKQITHNGATSSISWFVALLHGRLLGNTVRRGGLPLAGVPPLWVLSRPCTAASPPTIPNEGKTAPQVGSYWAIGPSRWVFPSFGIGAERWRNACTADCSAVA